MRRRTILLSITAVMLGIAGYVENISTIQTVYSSEMPVEQQVATTPTTPTPEVASTPAQNQAVAVTALQPAPKQAPVVIQGNSLTISSIGFQKSIVDVGVTAANAIDVPVSQVGRWIGSAMPGAPGAVFLDGHVDGVFARLNKVAVGQTISMNYNGQTFTYKVAFSEVVELATIDMNRSLSVYGNASEGLNIMTCAGTYIPSAGTYDKRLVVYATRIN